MSVWFITGASRASDSNSPVKRSLAATRSPPPPGIAPGAITEAIPDGGNALLAPPLDVTDPRS
jgi:hypothetical protein